MRWAALSIVVTFAASCTALLGIEDIAPGADASQQPDASQLVDCTAQRVLHIVGSEASLSWFTLVWPVPAVIEDFQPGFSYDDVTLASQVSTNRVLYARSQNAFGNGPLWTGIGTAPHPSAFAIGITETHTFTPVSAVTLPAGNVIGFGARAQVERISPLIPVLVLGSGPYVEVTGGPSELRAVDIDAAILMIRAQYGLTAAEEAELRPDAAVLDTWHSSGETKVIKFASEMLFAANLLTGGRVGTIIVEGYLDDPHDAFDEIAVTTQVATDTANILEGFYRELERATEPNCGYGGAPLSLADNVMTVISGDTPKNMFLSMGWPDGTPDNVNLAYVRSNGWLVPGWFGELTQSGRVGFDPNTGNASGIATPESDLAAALAGVLYAMTRGDIGFVESIALSPFGGVRSPTPP